MDDCISWTADARVFNAVDLNALGAASRISPSSSSVFPGKAGCVSCHPAPYYTDNLMHALQTERFYPPQWINGAMAVGDGPIKTFPLRGIRESPPYLHDGRLLTLEDSVEFFNLVVARNLTAEEKADLVAFLRVLQLQAEPRAWSG
jgi:cytochrome c peroxidase